VIRQDTRTPCAAPLREGPGTALELDDALELELEEALELDDALELELEEALELDDELKLDEELELEELEWHCAVQHLRSSWSLQQHAT